MNQERKLSFFLPPISPVKDANGKNVTPATLVPHKELTLEEVWNIVTGSPRLKKLTEAAAAAYGDEKEYRRLKQSTLPYVTPCGTFSYRRSDRLLAPSGLSILDLDHLDSREEAERMRRQLFDDPFLLPELVFVSPGGHGVKAFVPYDLETECGREHLLADGIRPPEVWRLLGQRQGQRSGLLGQRPGAGLLPVA